MEQKRKGWEKVQLHSFIVRILYVRILYVCTTMEQKKTVGRGTTSFNVRTVYSTRPKEIYRNRKYNRLLYKNKENKILYEQISTQMQYCNIIINSPGNIKCAITMYTSLENCCLFCDLSHLAPQSLLIFLRKTESRPHPYSTESRLQFLRSA